MGNVVSYSPVMLLAAHFSTHESALSWSRERLSEKWGNIILASDLFSFYETEYYAASMGRPLFKQLIAFEQSILPDSLAQIKHFTNQLESDYAAFRLHPEQRPLNIDPGYLELSQFVLATTKAGSHRLAIGQGIFAEVTLHFAAGRWNEWSWTYPDFRREDYKQFLTACRNKFLELGAGKRR